MKFALPIGITLLCLLPSFARANDFLSAMYETVEIPGVERQYFFQESDAVLQNAGKEFHPLFFDSGKEGEKPRLAPGHETNDCSVALSGERFWGDAIPFSTNVFSILLWVRPIEPVPESNTVAASSSSLILQNGDGLRSGWQFLVHDWKTRRIAFELATRKKQVQLRSSVPFPLDGWIQLAVVCDGKTIELFQNGISVCTTPSPRAGVTGQPNGFLQFGGKSATLPATRMDLSEFCFFDGVFTDDFLVSNLFPCIQHYGRSSERIYYSIRSGQVDSPRLVRSGDFSFVGYEHPYWLEVFSNTESPKFLKAMGPDYILRYVQNGLRIPSEFISDLRDNPQINHPIIRNQLDLLQAESYLQEQNSAAAREVIRNTLKAEHLPSFLSARLQMLLLETRIRMGEDQKAYELLDTMLKDSTSPSLEELFAALSLSRADISYKDRTNLLYRVDSSFLTPQRRKLLPSYLVKEVENAVKSCASADAQPQNEEEDSPTPPLELPAPYFSFYVAPDGNDTADGTIDKPFRTLERARDAVRLQKRNGRLPYGGIRVYLRGGSYPVTHPLRLLDIDSGSFQAPAVYLAYPGETPVLEAGIPLKIQRLSDKNLVFQTELPKSAAESSVPMLWDGGELLSYRPDQTSPSFPGDWTVNQSKNKILLSLKRQPFFAEPILAHLPAPFVTAEDAQDVIFSGITFRNGLRDAISMKKCKNIQVRSCTIEQMGNNGIVAGDSSNLRIYGNRFRAIGHSALLLHGGNRVSLTPSYIQVENNLITRTGLLSPLPAHAAIRLSGCAISIRHNDFIDIPGSVIQISGNDHWIERNRFERITYHADARSAIILSGDPSFRGNRIQRNLFRDVGFFQGSNAVSAIETLPGGCGLLVRNNFFDRVNSGERRSVILISGGQHHVIDANVFLHSDNAIRIVASEDWYRFLNTPEVSSRLMQTVNVFAFPYLTKYPELANLQEDVNRHFIWRNIFVGDDYPVQLDERTGQTESVANRSIIQKDVNRILSLLPESSAEAKAGRYPDPNRVDSIEKNLATEDRR